MSIIILPEAIASHTTLGEYDTVTKDSSLVFTDVDLNLGGG